MVIETLALLCSWHPGNEDKYNAANPGLFVSVGERFGAVHPYVTAGVYRDSYEQRATVLGGGCDFGERYGIGVTIAHVDGSGVGQYPFVPIPSVFYEFDNGALVRVFGSHQMIALGVGFTFGGGP